MLQFEYTKWVPILYDLYHPGSAPTEGWNHLLQEWDSPGLLVPASSWSSVQLSCCWPASPSTAWKDRFSRVVLSFTLIFSKLAQNLEDSGPVIWGCKLQLAGVLWDTLGWKLNLSFGILFNVCKVLCNIKWKIELP